MRYYIITFTNNGTHYFGKADTLEDARKVAEKTGLVGVADQTYGEEGVMIVRRKKVVEVL